MRYFHLTETADGISRFEDRDIALALSDFAPPAPPLHLSEFEAATQLCFLTLPPGWTGAAHRSPARQVALCLSGAMRVEAGDGSAREIRAGDIWRMEDTGGAGHRTSVIGDEDVRLAIVQLA